MALSALPLVAAAAASSAWVFRRRVDGGYSSYRSPEAVRLVRFVAFVAVITGAVYVSLGISGQWATPQAGAALVAVVTAAGTAGFVGRSATVASAIAIPYIFVAGAATIS